MNTRMDRYSDTDFNRASRVNKNKNLYSGINDDDIENIDLTSNVTVIRSDELKNIIGNKSNKSHMTFDDIDVDDQEEFVNTKEYDLKKVIDAARQNKPQDYDSDRYKKVRATEYDILNSLNLEKKEYIPKEAPLTKEEATIVDLMKTIKENELKSEDIKNADLMSDLMGNENTEVLNPIPIEDTSIDSEVSLKKPTVVEELEKTKQLSKQDVIDAEIKYEEKTEEIPEEKENKLANSFYTGKLSIKDSDLNDFQDLEKELKSNNVLIKILIIVVVLIVLVLIVFLLNKFLNLGLF